MNITNRRKFLLQTTMAGVALGLTGTLRAVPVKNTSIPGKRAGIIGLDTSHSPAFVKALNASVPNPVYKGYRVVAAYPHGSKDIRSSYERIPGYTEEVKKFGVEIMPSIEALLEKVDVVFLETNDGRLHLEQALQVFRAGKPVFIDKPVAASLKDAIAIYEAAETYKVPVFSASSLRYTKGARAVLGGQAGKVLGADTFSPMKIEPTHPDLFWYGIHGVESLFTVMGTGCVEVTRISRPGSDVVTGVWADGRIGTFRGLQEGKQTYGGMVFGDKEVLSLGTYDGYDALLERIIEFFETRIPPVSAKETIEIFAFMEAAEWSKKRKGATVRLADVMRKARKK